MSKATQQQLLDGIAEILEVPYVGETTVLAEVSSWDSLAIVCTIALLDEKAGVEVDGQALAACITAGDVLILAGAPPAPPKVAGGLSLVPAVTT